MADIIFGALLFLLSLAAYLYAGTFPDLFHTPGSTSSAWFPKLVCIALMVCCAFLICKAVFERKRKKTGLTPEAEKPVSFFGNKYGMVCLAITVAVTVVFVLLIGKIHFVIIASVYMIGLGLLYGMDWKKLVPISIASAVVLYLVFHNLLNIMLNG